MVKKTYIIPTTQMVAVEQQMVIADSPAVIVNRSGGAAPGSFDVKEDRTRPSDYNVWNDDWSNN